MGWIVYPPDLPGPAPGSFAPRSRRAGSSLDGAPQSRARQRDVAGLQQQLSWVYTPDEMALWRAWYETTLSQGRYWFAAYLPGLRGLKRPKLVRYLTKSEQLLGSGLYRVTATLELRAYLPEALYYVSAPYPYVAHESLSLELIRLRNQSGALLLDPIHPIDVGMAVPQEGGQLRNVIQTVVSLEEVGLNQIVPGNGQLVSVLQVFSQFGYEGLSSAVCTPVDGGVLRTVVVSQNQYGSEGNDISTITPGNGSLS